MTNVYCLGCNSPLDFIAIPELGQRIICPSCEARLEVINLWPLEVDWGYDLPILDEFDLLYDELDTLPPERLN